MTPLTPNPSRFLAFDLLATLVAVVRSDGIVLFANSALEDAMGQSRRTIEGSQFANSFVAPQAMSNALASAHDNEFAALRYDAMLLRQSYEPISTSRVAFGAPLSTSITMPLIRNSSIKNPPFSGCYGL